MDSAKGIGRNARALLALAAVAVLDGCSCDNLTLEPDPDGPVAPLDGARLDSTGPDGRADRGTPDLPPPDSSAACSVDSWCLENSQGKNLSGVWGSSATDVFAVGGDCPYGCVPSVLHYDGTSWKEQLSAAGPNAALGGVWGSSGTNVFAVAGHSGGGYSSNWILQYDGSSWKDLGASASSPCPKNSLAGLWGSSGSDIFAVGGALGSAAEACAWTSPILHYDGTGWKLQDSGTTNPLGGVWGSSGNDVFAVGWGGTILRYDGTSWKAMVSGTTARLGGVWGSSANDVFAVGSACDASGNNCVGQILHYDGTSWKPQASGATSGLAAVWGSSASDVFAVGHAGTILHYDGTSWKPQASGTTNSLYGVWGSSASDVIVVGGSGTILHRQL